MMWFITPEKSTASYNFGFSRVEIVVIQCEDYKWSYFVISISNYQRRLYQRKTQKRRPSSLSIY